MSATASPASTAPAATSAPAASRAVPAHPVPRWAIRLATLLGWFFAGAGVMRLLPVPFDVELFSSWGLPAWFRAAVGLAELAVGVLALRPGLRPVGLIGIGVVMVSAGTMHVALGHSLLVAALVNGPLALGGFAAAWATRFEVLR